MKTMSTSLTTRNLIKNAILLTAVALALSTSPRSPAAGDCYFLAYWDNSNTGSWFNQNNWGPYHNAVPDCGQCCGHPWEVDINNGGTAQITTGTARACETFLGKDTAQQSGTLSVDNATLDQCGDMWVGYSGKGTLSITNGGVVNTQFGAHIAVQTGSNGTATVDGTNSKWTVTVDGAALNVGGNNTTAGGTGLLTVKNGGVVTAASVHTYPSGTLTGNGTVSTTSATTIEGTLTPSGGTLTIEGDLTFSGLNPTMECHVVPASADNANVSGVASLTGKLSVTMTGTTFTAGTRFTLLHATGGFDTNHHTFPNVSIKGGSGDCFTPVITYDAYNVYLYLSPCSN